MEFIIRRCKELINDYKALSEHLDCFARVFKEYVEIPKPVRGGFRHDFSGLIL